MRRRPHLLAAVCAGGVVALCVATVGVGVAVAADAAHGPAADAADALIPPDLTWAWVSICEARATEGLEPFISYSMSTAIDEEGRLSVDYSTFDDEGNVLPDATRSAAVNECLSARRVDPDQGQYGVVTYPGATPAQRLGLYDWAVHQQQPCLAAHGIDTVVPPLEEFLDDQYIPWYLLDQYIWASDRGPVDVDFDELLATRLACPPVPAFLAVQGVG